MSGQVLITLTASDTWYGREIRKATKSNVNHALVLYQSSDWLDWRAIDTQEKGVTPAVSAKKLTRIDYLECWKCSVDLWKGLRLTKSDFFKKYDWIGLIFGFIRAVLANYLYIEITKPIHAHNRLFCSEYVAAVIMAAGVPDTAAWIPANMSPGDLKKFMGDSPHFTLVDVPTVVRELYVTEKTSDVPV